MPSKFWFRIAVMVDVLFDAIQQLAWDVRGGPVRMVADCILSALLNLSRATKLRGNRCFCNERPDYGNLPF